jgi:hypothetical protein
VQTNRRVRPAILLLSITVLAGLIAVGGYLASPLVIRTHMVEESPFAAVAQERAPAGPAGPSFMAAEAPMTVPAARATSELPAAPRVDQTRTGSFADRDQVHRGSGQAILGQTPQGTTVLRFESFSVTNGPDLHVFLSRSPRPTSHDEVHDGVYVGKLKASEGAFNYELPAGTDTAAIRSVVVYCVPFRVIFTSAPLA